MLKVILIKPRVNSLQYLSDGNTERKVE